MPNELDHRLGAQVRVLRNAQNLSQAELGARCRPPATSTQISKIEQGKQDVMRWVPRLAEALGVSTLDIVEPLDPQEAAIRRQISGMDEDAQKAILVLAGKLAAAGGTHR